MAAHERRTPNLYASVLGGFLALFCLCVLYVDADLNVDADGNIKFDPLPDLGEFTSDADAYKSDSSRPGTLGDMARGWVDLVQPKGFPTDYINHLILLIDGDSSEPIDVVDEVFLGLKNFVGIIICFLIGLFLFLILPWIGFIFCCCRCCNNCGGKRVQEETKSMGCWRVTHTIILLCLTAIICAGMAFTNVDNQFMGHAVDKTFDVSSNQLLADSSTFIAGADNQLSNILSDQYNDVDLRISADLDNIGELIGTPFQDYLKDEADVQETFDAFDKLIQDLQETTAALDYINSSSIELQDKGSMLETNLTDISTRLNNINTTCSGCVPSNVGLDVTDFSNLPDITGHLDRSRTSKRNISNQYDEVLEVYDSIPITINDEASDVVVDIKDALVTTKDQLQDVSEEFSDIINEYNDFITEAQKAINDAKQVQSDIDQYRATDFKDVKDWQSGVKAMWEHKDELNDYRNYAIIGLCCMVLLIVMFNIIGITMGTCSYKNVAPVDRSRMSNAGGNVLVAGVVFTFLFIPLLILLCCMFFLPLAINTLTCAPLHDLSLFSETIDRNDTIPSCEGYCLGNWILGNASIPLTVSGILESCGKNQSLYSSLMLDTVFNVEIIDEQLEELRKASEKLVDEISISDFDLDLVPDYFEQGLQAAIDYIALRNIDVNGFQTLLEPPPVPTNLEEYAAELEEAANNNPSVADDLNSIAAILRVLYMETVVPMETMMNQTLESVLRTQELAPILDTDANTTANAAYNSEALIDRQETDTALKDDVQGYIDVTLGYAEQYSVWAVTTFENDFARCQPVRSIYDTSISLVCYYAFDALNIFWFTLGWCVFFLIPSTIFSIKLAKYYRIMDDMHEPKPKKQKKKKKSTRNQDAENYPMDHEMDDMPHTGHGHHDNIRLVSNNGPPPMMAQQNPQYIPDEPIMAYQYNDLGRPMAPPPAYHPDMNKWPMHGIGPSQSSMLLPPYGYYPPINDARAGSSSSAAANYNPAWESSQAQWAHQQASNAIYEEDTRFAYNPSFVDGGHTSTDDFEEPRYRYPPLPGQAPQQQNYPQRAPSRQGAYPPQGMSPPPRGNSYYGQGDRQSTSHNVYDYNHKFEDPF